MESSDTVIKKTTYEDVSIRIREILEETGFFASEHDIVVIKPNLCDFRPGSRGTTTSIEVIKELILGIKERCGNNLRIIVTESNHALATADEIFDRLGFKELAEKIGFELLNLSEDKKVRIVINGAYFQTLSVAETLLRMTKFISVAKLKTHAQQKITCIMKNQFGLLHQRYKSKYHSFMSDVLYDLCEIFPPDLCLIDGIVSMEGSGPSDGLIKKTNVIVAGVEYLVTDYAAARVMGFKPESVPAIKNALKKGKHIKPVSYNGKKRFPKEFKLNFRFIPFYAYRLRRFAYWLERFGNKISSMLSGLSSFLSQASTGLIVLFRGYYIGTDLGTVTRSDAWRFGKGLIKRPIRELRLKTTWKGKGFLAFATFCFILIIGIGFIYFQSWFFTVIKAFFSFLGLSL